MFYRFLYDLPILKYTLFFSVLCALNCTVLALDGFKSFSVDSTFANAHEKPSQVSSLFKGENITIDVENDSVANVYVVSSSNPSHKYLILFHEWWGLNQHIRNTADSFRDSLSDVNVIAVDLYDGKVASESSRASQLMGSTSEQRVQKIIRSVVNYCGEKAEICTIGWCYGGGWSLYTAIDSPKRCKGCVIYYGMPEEDSVRLSNLSAPLLGIFATKDKWITTGIVKDFEKKLTKLGKKFNFQTYDSYHAFANPSNPNYDKRNAENAAKIVLRFIRANLSV